MYNPGNARSVPWPLASFLPLNQVLMPLQSRRLAQPFRAASQLGGISARLVGKDALDETILFH
jgi:hypothetical protein